jgi:hypothetical protein
VQGPKFKPQYHKKKKEKIKVWVVRKVGGERNGTGLV